MKKLLFVALFVVNGTAAAQSSSYFSDITLPIHSEVSSHAELVINTGAEDFIQTQERLKRDLDTLRATYRGSPQVEAEINIIDKMLTDIEVVNAVRTSLTAEFRGAPIATDLMRTYFELKAAQAYRNRSNPQQRRSPA